MRTVSPPSETSAQKEQRQRSEADNVRSIQETVEQRTDLFRRRKSNRVSLATGASSRGGLI